SQGGTDIDLTNLTIWEAASRRAIRTLKGHDMPVHEVAFALKADPPLLASASENGIRIWDVMSSKEIQKLDSGWMRCVAFSPHGDLVACGGVDRVIRIWDT